MGYCILEYHVEQSHGYVIFRQNNIQLLKKLSSYSPKNHCLRIGSEKISGNYEKTCTNAAIFATIYGVNGRRNKGTREHEVKRKGACDLGVWVIRNPVYGFW